MALGSDDLTSMHPLPADRGRDVTDGLSTARSQWFMTKPKTGSTCKRP